MYAYAVKSRHRLFQQIDVFTNMANSSSFSLESLGAVVRDRLNIGGKTKCLSSEKDVVGQFNDDNRLVVKSRLVEMMFITLLPYLEMVNLKDSNKGDEAAYMLELH